MKLPRIEAVAITIAALLLCTGTAFAAPGPLLEIGLDQYMKLSTSVATDASKGLIQLQAMNDAAKPYIAFQDPSGKDDVWLQYHNCLDVACTNVHRHFSVEASDASGAKQTRLSVGYGADVVDVGVNQANFVINRNTGMKNGNLLMAGGGGGGAFKHAGAFSFYPRSATNDAYALKLDLSGAGEVTLSALGSNTLVIDDAVKTTGKFGVGIAPAPNAHVTIKAGSSTAAPLKLTPGPLLDTPVDGTFEYDGEHLYFTIGTSRIQID